LGRDEILRLAERNGIAFAFEEALERAGVPTISLTLKSPSRRPFRANNLRVEIAIVSAATCLTRSAWP